LPLGSLLGACFWEKKWANMCKIYGPKSRLVPTEYSMKLFVWPATERKEFNVGSPISHPDSLELERNNQVLLTATDCSR
jgi:hypothetical protein